MAQYEYRREELRPVEAPGTRADAASSTSAALREPLLEVDPIPVRVRFTEYVTQDRWQLRQWRPESVEPVAPLETDRSGKSSGPSASTESAESSVAPGQATAGVNLIEVFPDEAEGYWLNLTSGDPSIMVRWRLPEDETGVAGEQGEPTVLAITLSYNEAGRWMDGGERVDRVPMPAEMQAWLAEFVRLHWRPETRHKQRGPKPSFMKRKEFSEMIDRERERLRAAGLAGETAAGDPTGGATEPAPLAPRGGRDA